MLKCKLSQRGAKTPSTKFQYPGKFQAPISKRRIHLFFRFDVCSFGFGVWTFRPFGRRHIPCLFLSRANGETISAQSRSRPGHFFPLRSLQSRISDDPAGRGNDAYLSKVREADECPDPGETDRRCAGSRRRNSTQIERERVSACRSNRQHQSVVDPVASLAVADANIERAKSGARKRAQRESVKDNRRPYACHPEQSEGSLTDRLIRLDRLCDTSSDCEIPRIRSE